MQIRELMQGDAEACEAIVRGLPAWFGLEDGIQEARGYLQTQEGLVAEDASGVLGYLTWTNTVPECVEVTWMAVAHQAHRRGVGRALVDRLVGIAEAQGARMMAVKTLAELHPSMEYAQTRAFYRSMGFLPVMVLPDLWGAETPCLVMVRPLA